MLLSNQTHRSNSDEGARLFRKLNSTGAYLSYLGHCLMENRHGLVVASEVRMARSLKGAHQKKLGADKGYGKSINARNRIEQVFGWIKQAAGLRQLKARGRSRVGAVFRLHVVAYNLICLANLLSPREAFA